MPITIENPTAEAAFQALRQLPTDELKRLKEMFTVIHSSEGFQDFWTDEDIEDFRRSTARLMEKRLGEEKHDYD